MQNLPDISLLFYEKNEIIWNYEIDPKLLGQHLQTLTSREKITSLIKESIAKEVMDNPETISFFQDVINHWGTKRETNNKLPLIKASEVFI